MFTRQKLFYTSHTHIGNYFFYVTFQGAGIYLEHTPITMQDSNIITYRAISHTSKACLKIPDSYAAKTISLLYISSNISIVRLSFKNLRGVFDQVSKMTKVY